MARLSLCLMIGLLAGCTGDQETSHHPQQAFQTAFGATPSSTIADLQGRISGHRDWEDGILGFRTTRPHLNSLIGASFAITSRVKFLNGAHRIHNRPSWWTATSSGTNTVFLESSDFPGHFAFEQAFVSFDPDTDQVFLYWSSSE